MSTATADKPRASGRRAALQTMVEAAYLEAQALTQDHEKEKAPADQREPSVKFKLPGYHFGPARRKRR